jgi:hypothetical protein
MSENTSVGDAAGGGAAPGNVAADVVEATASLLELSVQEPTAGDHDDPEHASRAEKRRIRRKRAHDSARKLRRSLRLQEKEDPKFEMPEDKAARVQQSKFDFSGAS